MADLPQATLSVVEEAGGFGTGTDLLVVMGCTPSSADGVPRVMSSAQALLDQHGYCAAVDYCAMHFGETKKPILFIGLPTVTAGYVGSQDQSGITGTAPVAVAAGADGVHDEVDGVLTVVTGGVVGTDQILCTLSLDGGRTSKTVRFGTATSYTVPYLGFVLTLGSGSTLVADDVFTFRAFPARPDQAGKQAARVALAAQQKAARAILLVDDCAVKADATDFVDELNLYQTANDRFIFGRAQVRDMRPAPKMARVRVRMVPATSLTFAEVGVSGDTITRATGSWITDGFAVGDTITVTGSASNNITAVIASLSATVITLGTEDLTNETTAAASVYGTPLLTFAEVGASGDTITRSRGSWLNDGFAVGDAIDVTGTVSNNVTNATIAALSATVLTLDTTDLAAETIGSYGVSISASAETKAEAVAANDAEFADIDADFRVDLAHGRARKSSPITGAKPRRPAAWAASLREFQHDVQIPTYRKDDGPLDGWDLEDEEGNLVEHDDRVDGGALAARFTCLRTWANGPSGPFVALSLTRGNPDSQLSRTHNVAVLNVFSAVVQRETENAVGQVLVLNSDGTATEASLVELEARVNSAIARELLQRKKEGPRASSASWSASRSDVLNVPGAELTGSGDLGLNGTIERVSTSVRVH